MEGKKIKFRLRKRWRIKTAETRKIGRLNVALASLLFVLAIFCMCVGRYPVSAGESLLIIFGKIFGSFGHWEPITENVVMGLRLPRILASILVGGSLSVSGAAYQGVFKNPLVSPDFLGVSSGACIGAAVAILLSLGSAMTQLFAFIGGILAVSITILIPKMLRSNSNIMLVLSGVIVGGLMSSVLGFIKYMADPETQLAAITYWQMGDFSFIKLDTLFSILPTILLPAALLFAVSWWIDILSLGEKDARSLGTNVGRMRSLVILCATLLTASSVCVAGTIGWVGLVIPHFTRMLVGPENTRLLPTSFLIGSAFLLLADTITRTIGPAEMPISILTGIVGAPFYAWLLYRQRMQLQ